MGIDFPPSCVVMIHIKYVKIVNLLAKIKKDKTYLSPRKN